jgi:hypothetical protein
LNSTETGNNTDKEFRDFSDNKEAPQTEETQQLTINMNMPVIAPKRQLTQPQSSAQAQTPA